MFEFNWTEKTCLISSEENIYIGEVVRWMDVSSFSDEVLIVRHECRILFTRMIDFLQEAVSLHIYFWYLKARDFKFLS